MGGFDFAFCMVNPPFFESEGEHLADPSKICTASGNEVCLFVIVVVVGGGHSFVHYLFLFLE